MRVNGWVTVSEAAKITKRTRKTIYQWVRDGKVATMRPGRALWLKLSDVRHAEKALPGRPRKNG
ncbi:helix-turn-helix domain-containing protein [Microbacterium sp. ZXX196]|uniref:helix-turn-helix domain-containing protein n=1 Tax=Microbacterium sp. ZXX196 TaxID=2609291 RepID=UPI0012B78CD7|nr:excisionase family DNA-binding protein [Microbacterium sp. ZXX196]